MSDDLDPMAGARAMLRPYARVTSVRSLMDVLWRLDVLFREMGLRSGARRHGNPVTRGDVQTPETVVWAFSVEPGGYDTVLFAVVSAYAQAEPDESGPHLRWWMDTDWPRVESIPLTFDGQRWWSGGVPLEEVVVDLVVRQTARVRGGETSAEDAP